MNNVAGQMNSRIVDKWQDGSQTLGGKAHLFGLPGWHLQQYHLRQLSEAAREARGVADKGGRPEEVDAPAGFGQGVTNASFGHGLHWSGDAVDVGTREAVDEPTGARPRRAMHRERIGVSVDFVEAVVKGAVHDSVEASLKTSQLCGIGDVEAHLDTRIRSADTRLLDRRRRAVEARHRITATGQVDCVVAKAATSVEYLPADRPECFEFHQSRLGLPDVPRDGVGGGRARERGSAAVEAFVGFAVMTEGF